MGRFLLGTAGVKYILSERFTQDPVESFFGHQRQRGGGRDNPTAQQFMQATQSIRVQQSTRPVTGSNVRACSKSVEHDVHAPVPKRRRTSRSSVKK